jgi:hypothetical protein
MKTIQGKIKELLIQKIYLRDCDKKLCTHIWYRELLAKGIDPAAPTTDFFRLYAAGKVTSDATVARLRAKLQELHPELRGQKYLERQNKQSKVQSDLGYGSQA